LLLLKWPGEGLLSRKKSSSGNLQRPFTDIFGVEPDRVTILIDELDRDNIGMSGRMLSEIAHT
jgi:hypothetical protein